MNSKVVSVFHVTPLENLQSILNTGLLLPDNYAKPIKNFGDPDLKAKRRRLQVAVEPGGNLADYTPFYFTPQSPMMYQFVRSKIRQSTFVFFRLDFKPDNTALVEGSPSIVISAHPLSNLAVTERATAKNIDDLVKWKVIFSDDYSSTGFEFDDWVKFRQAELLIHKGLKIDSPNVKLLVRTDDALAKVDALIKSFSLEIYSDIDEKLFFHYNLLE